MSTQDTIFALSSAPGKAGVAVIRVSGPLGWKSVNILTNSDTTANKLVPNEAKLLNLSYLVSRETRYVKHIDKAFVVGFRAPKSFTGEDVVEYHCHGSPAIIEEMFEALGSIEGCRMAEHGEFTRRAFENGKLDLTEAEAIADLIDAETRAQKDQALAQMGGVLSALYHGWAERLTRSLAYIEAIIDFPDEDVPDSETKKALPEIEAVSREIRDHLDDNRRGERLRNGLQIAVIGVPNAGKSSLVNALAQRDVAIVSDMAGTTRDVIEVHLNLGGYPVIIADTAGLRPDQITGDTGQEAIESEGIKRALEYAQQADLKLLVFDGAAEKPDQHTLNLVDENSLALMNKQDLFEDDIGDISGETPLAISTITGQGLDEFLDVLSARIAKMMQVSRETPSLTRQRHRMNLNESAQFLENALEQAQPEFMAQELRFAVNSLGRITGRVDVEDLLDVIFKDFCIGK
ncbi:MAG: tRNA uridine-5-carboxymethylaminomethyl(34) synthesis GTPase MnmE [Alphaproteobacteria bacterium]|nr:tRNA uridine-5-carboxymethylaminomethyl(34) synthesis GTPase MnmE [Alphaproteobacteria bacterium]